jgi:hypothetical protein
MFYGNKLRELNVARILGPNSNDVIRLFLSSSSDQRPPKLDACESPYRLYLSYRRPIVYLEYLAMGL